MLYNINSNYQNLNLFPSRHKIRFLEITLKLLTNKKFKIMGLLWTLLIGAIAGYLGSLIFKGGTLGLIGNIIVGLIGSFIGHLIFGQIGTGVLGEIVTGTIGAIILLAVINLFTRGKV